MPFEDYEIAADGFAALRALIRIVVEEAMANRQGRRAGDRTPPLIGLEDVARRLNVSTTQVSRLRRDGKMLRPIMIGNAYRWDPEELTAWIKAGAPDRKTWEAEKAKAAGRVQQIRRRTRERSAK
jgi:predicted DNA-binding transcriptional regulator AlpA